MNEVLDCIYISTIPFDVKLLDTSDISNDILYFLKKYGYYEKYHYNDYREFWIISSCFEKMNISTFRPMTPEFSKAIMSKLREIKIDLII